MLESGFFMLKKYNLRIIVPEKEIYIILLVTVPPFKGDNKFSGIQRGNVAVGISHISGLVIRVAVSDKTVVSHTAAAKNSVFLGSGSPLPGTADLSPAHSLTVMFAVSEFLKVRP